MTRVAAAVSCNIRVTCAGLAPFMSGTPTRYSSIALPPTTSLLHLHLQVQIFTVFAGPAVDMNLPHALLTQCCKAGQEHADSSPLLHKANVSTAHTPTVQKWHGDEHELDDPRAKDNLAGNYHQ